MVSSVSSALILVNPEIFSSSFCRENYDLSGCNEQVVQQLAATLDSEDIAPGAREHLQLTCCGVGGLISDEDCDLQVEALTPALLKTLSAWLSDNMDQICADSSSVQTTPSAVLTLLFVSAWAITRIFVV